MIRAWVVFFALLFLGAGFTRAEVAVPPLQARVTDLTHTLSGGEIVQLEEKLVAFESKKGSQLAILIVPTTQPETIEQYGIRVAESWKLGRKGVDDGALLLIAKDDRSLRIEVGYGLEGALNDATAKRIVSEIIAPRFRASDFYGGIVAGIQSMMMVIDGEPLPPPRRSASSSSSFKNIESLLFVGFILVIVLGGMLRALFGRFAAATVIGTVTGLLAWLIIAPLVVAIIVGAIGFLFTLLGGGRSWYGGWPASYGGGGFSGGGGGFGGGGASGSW